MNAYEINIERIARKIALQALVARYPLPMPRIEVSIACKSKSDALHGISDATLSRALSYLESCGHVSSEGNAYKATASGVDSLGACESDLLLRWVCLNCLYIMAAKVDTWMLSEYISDCGIYGAGHEKIKSVMAYLCEKQLSKKTGDCWGITHIGTDYLQGIGDEIDGVKRYAATF